MLRFMLVVSKHGCDVVVAPSDYPTEWTWGSYEEAQKAACALLASPGVA